LGFGLRIFTKAKLEPGFDLYARQIRLDRHLGWAQVVLTGEGRIDRSSLMGKGVGEIARRARRRHLPCLGFGGVIRDREVVDRWFTRADALTPDLASIESAFEHPARWLSVLTRRAATL
jgi:glycerate kinase